MFVGKSMTKKVITVAPDAEIISAQEIMKQNNIRHLPVVIDDDNLVGIVTDRDIRSFLPSLFTADSMSQEKINKISSYKIKDIMTKNPATVSPVYTIQDVLLLFQKLRVGAMPVVNEKGRLKGIISVRDLLRAFTNVLGIGEPGTLICVLAEEKIGQLKKIIDVITEENISFGSILVAKYWDKGMRAVFIYLLTNNLINVKKRIRQLGFKLLDPMEWYLDQLPKKE